jgi:hypothetical protein
MLQNPIWRTKVLSPAAHFKALQHGWPFDDACQYCNTNSYVSDETRSALLKLCLEGVTVHEALDSNVIADKLEGYTGSDISNVCR